MGCSREEWSMRPRKCEAEWIAALSAGFPLLAYQLQQ